MNNSKRPPGCALEAVLLRGNRYAVRPEGSLGTCGWYPYAWTVHYVNARGPAEAVRKAIKEGA